MVQLRNAALSFALFAAGCSGQIMPGDTTGSPDGSPASRADLGPPSRPLPDGGAPPDLAGPPPQTDMSMGNPAGPTLTSVTPDTGGAGTVVVLEGAFEAGDVPEIGGTNLSPTALWVVGATATAITAVIPPCNVTTPAALSVHVRRAATTSTERGFQLQAGRAIVVAPTGNDSGAGTTGDPLRTPGAALAAAKPGDNILLRAGTYNGQIQINNSGTATAPITMAAWPGEDVLIVEPSTSPGSDLDTIRIYGAYVTLRNLRITDQNNPGQVVWIANGANHIVLDHDEIFGSHGQGILISGDDNVVHDCHIHDNGVHTPLDHGIYIEGGGNLIQGNLIHNNWTFGVQLYDGHGATHPANVVEYNYIYGNGYGAGSSAPSAGMVIGAGHPNSVVRYNRFCDNAQYGIYLIDGQTGAQITDNVTCYNNLGGVYLRYPGSGTVVSGHVSYNDKGFAIYGASGVSSDANDYYTATGALTLDWNGASYTSVTALHAASGQDATSRVADPGFANVPKTSFDLTAAQSYNFCSAATPKLCDPTP